MSQQAYIYINYNNIVVLKTYLDIIKEALEQVGYSCEYVKSLKSINKKSLIIFPMGVDAFKYYFKGYHNFILWQQGVTSEESYLRNHSKIRFFILNFTDCFVMKEAKVIFYVSNNLKKYYERIGKCSFDAKAYIMPCFNEELDVSIFEKKDYTKKVFTYVGSLDLWQCFDKTVDLYAEIEQKIPNTFFKVLTFETDKANRILKEKGIKNYSVGCVPKDNVKEELLDTTFGFIIRDDIEVNRVATPTKFSSYLAAGVLPIYSHCLEDFANVVQNKKIAFGIKSNVTYSELLNFINSNHVGKLIENEIFYVFDSYYSASKHIINITKLLKEVIL